MAHRISHHNDGQLVYVAIDADGVIDHADFAHPFIAVDYDADDNLIGFSASGPAIDAALAIHKDHWRDPTALVAQLNKADQLVPA